MEGKQELDMSVAMEELVSSFIDMDGNSRVMFMKLIVTKMNDQEVDLILEVKYYIFVYCIGQLTGELSHIF